MTNYDEARSLPTSELDLNLMLTNSVWGRTEVPNELKDKLSKIWCLKDNNGKQIFDQQGRPVVDKASLWGLLGFYTRDMRLGNLSTYDNELQYCRYMIDLAGDFLQVDMYEPFIICLSRAATLLETSQSKGGFLRKTMNTLRQESVNQTLEPPKKGFFGGKNNGNSQGGY